MNLLSLTLLAAAIGFTTSQLLIPEQSNCPDGTTAVVVLHQDKGPNGATEGGKSSGNHAKCSNDCKANQDCAGFTHVGQDCTWYSSADPASLADQAGLKFYQKACVASTSVCSAGFTFEMVPKHILVGHARHVESTDSVQGCLAACLNSVNALDFECQSFMYYPDDQECILNTEDRLNAPTVFNAADENVLYFDNNCAGSQCYSPSLTQFIRAEKQALHEHLDLEVFDLSLDDCKELCIGRYSPAGEDLNCKAFMYDPVDPKCYLADERSMPLGRAVLSPHGNLDYYEKKCFKAKQTCRNTPAYDRVPQKILVGFAAYVIEKVESVTQCLDACVDTPSDKTDANFVCKSVMYYYNELECILNSETRATKPDLFIDEGEGFQVDYFDINCQREPEQCPSGATYTTVKQPNHEIAETAEGGDSVVLETLTGQTPEQCRDACSSRVPEKCRSFNYNEAGQSCNLMLLDTDTTVKVTPKDGTDYYEDHCIPGDNTGNCAEAVAAFDLVPKMGVSGDPTVSIPGPVSINNCLHRCINEAGADCRAAVYHTNNGRCDLHSTSEPREDSPDKNLYLANCRGEMQTTLSTRPPTISPTLEPEPAGPVGVSTMCNFDGIKVVVNQGAKFTGAVFAKMKYDTCRVEVKDEASAMLLLGFPTAKAETVVKRSKRSGGAGQHHPNTPQNYNSQPSVQPSYGGQNQPPVPPSQPSYGGPGPRPTQGQTYGSQTQRPVQPSYGPQPTQGGSYGGPGPQPTQGGSYAGPGPQPTQGGNYGGPGPQPTQGGSYAGPGPQPTQGSRYGGPGPQPTQGGSYAGPGPQPTQGGTYGGPGPQPTQGGSYGGPGPQPTQGGSYGGPGPQPTQGGGYSGQSQPSQPAYGGQQPVQPNPPSYGGNQGPSQPNYQNQQVQGSPSLPAGTQPSGGYGGSQSGGSYKPVAPVRDCGVQDMMNGQYMATIVVQSNNMGIPGLVTAGDKIYKVTCDYSQVTGEKKTAEATLQANGPEASVIKPRGKIELKSPVMMMMMNGETMTPILQAKLGDMLELRWEMMALDDQMDFFVKECTAERGGGDVPSPSSSSSGGGYGGGSATPKPSDPLTSLKLIEQGCPTPAVAKALMPTGVMKMSSKLKTAKLRAFRFDGARSVRIICKLEICQDTCNPTICDVDGQKVESFGRKKRDAPSENDAEYDPYLHYDRYETSEYFIPRRTHAMASLVIVDPLQDLSSPAEQMAAKYRREQHVVKPKASVPNVTVQRDEVAFSQAGHVCLPKSTFLGIFIFLGILALTQGCVVVGYLIVRVTSKRL